MPGGRLVIGNAVEVGADADMVVTGDLDDMIDMVGDLRRP